MRFFKELSVISIILLAFGSVILWNFTDNSSGTLVSGPVSGTWTLNNSPYYLDGDITIEQGQALIIEPGVSIIAKANYQILVEGKLFANGTFGGNIYFQGNSSLPGDYKWEGIIFNSTGSGTIENCSIENAYYGVRIINASNVQVKYSTFNTNNYAILCDSQSFNNSFNNCAIKYNNNGCKILNSTNNTFSDCEINNNWDYGMLFENSSHNLILETSVNMNDFGIQFNRDSRNNTIDGSFIEDNSGYIDSVFYEVGIEYLDGSTFNSMVNSRLMDNSIEINGVTDSNILFYNNRLSGNVNIKDSQYITISQCYTYDYPDGFLFERVRDIYIDNCNIYSYEVTFDIRDNSENVNIDQCQLTSYVNSGIIIQDSTNIKLSNLTISNSNKGVHLSYSNNITIQDVTITDNEFGIYIVNTDNTWIQSSIIQSSESSGIILFESQGLFIDDCLVRYNDNGGLNIGSYQSDIQIIDSDFYENNLFGCRIDEFCSDIIINNSGFTINYIGLHLLSSDNVFINHCKFNYNYEVGVYFSKGNQTIYNSEFKLNIDAGVLIDNGVLYIDNCIFEDNRFTVDLNAQFANQPVSVFMINSPSNSLNNVRYYYNKIYIFWELDIEVKAQSGIPVPGASVSLIPRGNMSNKTIKEYKTTIQGKTPKILCCQSLEIYDELIEYNPYRIQAHKSGIGVDERNVNITNSSTITMNLTNMDLRISSISPVFPNEKIPTDELLNIITEIENLGDDDVKNVELKLQITGNGMNQTFDRNVPLLASHELLKVQLDAPLIISQPGQYMFTSTIDPQNKILETDEMNNILTSAFEISERPIAVLVANRTSVYVGDEITFYANGSTGPLAILKYIFDFDDDEVVTEVINNFVTHSYIKKGEYTVKLQVVDKDGIPSYHSNVTITVSPRLKPVSIPMALFKVQPVTGSVLTEFHFDPSASTPSEGAWLVQYQWTFGDGTNDPRVLPSHKFNDDGEFEVTLVVTDSNNRSSKVFTQIITVKNLRPVVNLTLNKYEVTVGEVLVLNASNTYDPDDTLGEALTQFFWYFGDDNNYTEGPIQFPDGKYDMLTNYAFSEPGNYIITLIVSDDNGMTNQTSVNVKVKAKPINNPPDNSGAINSNVIFAILVIIAICIVILVIFLIARRRKGSRRGKAKEYDKLAERLYGSQAQDTNGDYSDGYGRKSKGRYGASGYMDNYKELYGEYGGGKGSGAHRPAGKKSKNGSVKRKSRTDSLHPVEVSVDLPDEKVIEWKDEQNALNHTLSMGDVEEVTDGDLSGAEIIGLEDDADEGYEEFDELGEFGELEELEELDEPPDHDTDTGSFESFEEMDDMVNDQDFDEPENEVEFEEELEPDRTNTIPVEEYDDEDEYATEVEAESGYEYELEDDTEDTLVFEFEDEDGIRTAELNVTPEEISTQQSEHKKKEKLIAIPGVGFVTKEELRRAVHEEVRYPEFERGTMDTASTQDQGRGLGMSMNKRCMNCYTPIKGKFIKIRPKTKDTFGKKFAAIGPFCSPKCAAKFQEQN